MMKVDKFVNILEVILKDYKTLYVRGCFGAPMTQENKIRYSKNCSYNKQRSDIIKKATSDTFGFDCVCLIKGVLWGWCGQQNTRYGGAKYQSNNVKDVNADDMFDLCTNQSTEFSNIIVGAFVHLKGHCGIYVGNGYVIECTPKWNNCVQKTLCYNIYNDTKQIGRYWTEWGLLPYIDYATKSDKTINIKFNNEIKTLVGEERNGKTYIWLRELENLGLGKVNYDSENKIAELVTK